MPQRGMRDFSPRWRLSPWGFLMGHLAQLPGGVGLKPDLPGIPRLDALLAQEELTKARPTGDTAL
jgi:hypothetical protein